MSKVEKALQKALALDGLQTAAPATEDRELVSPSMELRPYVSPVGRMLEPWRLSEAEMAAGRIIYPEMRDRRVADAFRDIRTKVLQAGNGRNAAVLVTSITEGDGASFVALNLAAAFAFDDAKSALLVDCNLRTPTLDRLISSEAYYGLGDYLTGEDVTEQQIIHPAGISRLRLIPAGKKSDTPTEKLGSGRMRELLNRLKQKYADRYLILDAPSIADSADVPILTELSDFVLLVVGYGKATEEQVWSAVKSIDEQKFLGVVFNNEPQLPSFTH